MDTLIEGKTPSLLTARNQAELLSNERRPLVVFCFAYAPIQRGGVQCFDALLRIAPWALKFRRDGVQNCNSVIGERNVVTTADSSSDGRFLEFFKSSAGEPMVKILSGSSPRDSRRLDASSFAATK